MRKIWDKLFVAKTNNTSIQLFRYFFVGGLAFSSDFLLLYFLTSKLGVYYLVSAPVAYMFGVILNYFLSIKWIFKDSGLKNKWWEFFFFMIIGVIGLFLNQALLWFCTGIVGLFYLYSKLISTIIVYLWNFFGRKWFLYNKKQPQKAKIQRKTSKKSSKTSV